MPATSSIPNRPIRYAKSRPDLQQCPIKLNAALWDTFSPPYQILPLLGQRVHRFLGLEFNLPEIRTKIISHGDLVQAAFIQECIAQGWDPNNINISSVERNINENISQNFQFLYDSIKKPFIGIVNCYGDFGILSKIDLRMPRQRKKTDALLSGKQSIYQGIVDKIKKFPNFFGNANKTNQVMLMAMCKELITVATSSQRRQKNHKGIVNLFIDTKLSATINADGLDLDQNGTTDYFCPIYNKKAIGLKISEDANSYATPKAFAQYACRLMKKLSSDNKTEEEAQQQFEQLNLYDYAFPDEETYKHHDSYGKNGYQTA